MGRRIAVAQPGEIIAASLARYLEKHPELGLQTVAGPRYEYFTTDSPETFQNLGEKFLGQEIIDPTKAVIAES